MQENPHEITHLLQRRQQGMNRAQFFGVGAHMMCRILAEHVRGENAVSLDEALSVPAAEDLNLDRDMSQRAEV